MIKKNFALIVCLFILGSTGFAKEIPIKLTPAYKISTSDINLNEGDTIDFLIVEDVFYCSKKFFKKGQNVKATITSLEDNDFNAKPAGLYIENFTTNDINGNKVKLKGIIFKKGNEHRAVTDWIKHDFVRGGEAHLFPEKDIYTLYWESGK